MIYDMYYQNEDGIEDDSLAVDDKVKFAIGISLKQIRACGVVKVGNR